MTDEEKREKARLERNRYYREYRAKNKEKIKKINDRYWSKRAIKAEESGVATNV